MTDDVRVVQAADVYKAGRRAATLRRHDGGIVFAYDQGYDGPAVSLTMPVSEEPRFTPAGSVPPFFAGLLPEGRRFSSLQRSLKTSADDELSLLLAVGGDTIGDVVVVAQGVAPTEAPSLIEVQKDFTDIRFSALLAETGIVDAVGLPGVQDKVSARVISLPVATSHDRYILKLNPPEYPHVVENEAYFIALAKRSRMAVVDAKLVFDADGVAGLLVRRFDRTASAASQPRSVACEDACQILDKWPGDKYNVTSEELALRVASVCSSPSVAVRDVFRQLCFAWLIGNGDVHAKNISVLQQESGEWRVSPVYDLPSTLFYGDYSMALPISGQTDGLSRRRWLDFAESIDLARPAAERVIDELLLHTVDLCDEIDGGALPFAQKTLRDASRNMANRRKLLQP